jgi:hypothetical protein
MTFTLALFNPREKKPHVLALPELEPPPSQQVPTDNHDLLGRSGRLNDKISFSEKGRIYGARKMLPCYGLRIYNWKKFDPPQKDE